jgi:hypothetical protein
MDIVKSALALLEGEYLREGKVVRQQRERVRDLYELGVVRDDSYATLQVGSITYGRLRKSIAVAEDKERHLGETLIDTANLIS